MAIAAANAWHHDFQYAVVQYFAERNTSACLCVVNCCLRLKLAITFYLYVILPVRILSVDFGVYSMSRVEGSNVSKQCHVATKFSMLSMKTSFCPIFYFSNRFVQHYASALFFS